MKMPAFSLGATAGPTVGIELAGHRVSAVSMTAQRGRPAVSAHAMETLPEGALVPSLTAVNVRDRRVVVAALQRVLERVGGARRVGLVVPDPIAKVSLVKFQQVPARGEDLDQLIRWQVRKSAPFPLEDAQLSYVAGAPGPDGQEYIVTIARRETVAEYESVCDEVGAQAGLVDLSTFNVANAVLAGWNTAEDWLLVNVTPDWLSMAILRGGQLISFRSRSADGEGALAELVHQTAMYYEDRLNGGGFSQVMLCGASSAGPRQSVEVDQLQRRLTERLATPVASVDPRLAVTLGDRIVETPALLDTLAPLVGLLVRDSKVAA